MHEETPPTPPPDPRPAAPFFTPPMVEAYEELGEALQAEARRRLLAREMRAIFLGFLHGTLDRVLELDRRVLVHLFTPHERAYDLCIALYVTWRPWRVVPAQLLLFADRGDRTLGVTLIHPDPARSSGWNVVAIETAATPSSAQAVFDDHGHHLVAEGLPLARAKDLAETYAAAWLTGASPPPCTCTDIHPGPPPAA